MQNINLYHVYAKHKSLLYNLYNLINYNILASKLEHSNSFLLGAKC